MAATSIPQLLAYAETAGYAGHRGLSTAGWPLLAWGLATGHPYLNAGVTSLTAVMARSDVRGDDYYLAHHHNQGSGGDVEEGYVYLMASYSLWVGVASLLLAALGFGSLVSRVVPLPVRAGFKWGCAVGVLLSALPNGLFDKGGTQLKEVVLAQSTTVRQVLPFLQHYLPGGINVVHCAFALTHPHIWSVGASIIFWIGTAFVVYGSKRLLPTWCPPGTDVVLLTAMATWYSATQSYSGSIVGEIPVLDANAGWHLGPMRVPLEFLDVARVVRVAPLLDRFGGSLIRLTASATAYAAVNFLSIVGIASGFESEDGISWSARRELASQGVACLAAASVGSAPVSGSLSRSLVSRLTGATSQCACLITALFWIYGQPYMSIMSPCPKAALSAVIVSAVVQGVLVPKELLRLQGLDALYGWITGLLTLGTSPTAGFGAGIVLYYLGTGLSNGISRKSKAKAD